MKKTDIVILCFFFLGYVWHLHDNANLFPLFILNVPKVIRLLMHPQRIQFLKIFIL